MQPFSRPGDAARSIETSVSDTMSTFQTQADELNKIASGDIAGLTETKPESTAASDTAGSTPADAGASANASTHADAALLLAAAEAMPGPALAAAEIPPEGSMQTGSQSGSQGTLPLECAPTNASGVASGAKSPIASASA